tara:strand:+ start:545 stop:769 length:225 start_codon:yes stop_codon:yes gene_type:complete
MNRANVKRVAKEVAKQVHGKDLNVSKDFLEQCEKLLLEIIKTNVVKQQRLKKTLTRTEWGQSMLREAREYFNAC